MPSYLFALLMGYILDLCLKDFGYTYRLVCRIKDWIRTLEIQIRNWFSKTEKGEIFAEGVFVGIVSIVLGGGGAILLLLADLLHPMVSFLVASMICYQMLHTKSIQDKSRKVYRELKTGNLNKARKAVSVFVGENMDLLSEEEVAKTTVEMVTEHMLDGVIAPLFYMALFGPIGGIVYWAINTMDDLSIGQIPAKLKNAVNYVPSYLSAGLMIIACAFLQMPVKEAYRIFRRDGYGLDGLSFGQVEAVCAGALGIQLLGDIWYGKELHQRPPVGDAKRRIRCEDIVSVNRMLSVSSYLGLVLFTLGCWAIWNLLR